MAEIEMKTAVIPTFRFSIALCLLATIASIAAAQDTANNVGSQAFFKQHCCQCHDEREGTADVRLDLLSDTIDVDNLALWKEVVHTLQRGEMPPENETQPTAEARQAFLKTAMQRLDRYAVDITGNPDPLMRLTNKQLANSVRDLLGISRDISTNLIEDPVHKHGFSLQRELQTSGGYMQLYLSQLRLAVGDAIPDPSNELPVYRIAGNQWEKQHYLTNWGLSKSSGRSIYRGPKWLGDDFEIPLPPAHEYRMQIYDNRAEGDFRILITLRNEPPSNGGVRTPQEVSVYLDQGFMWPYKLVDAVTVSPKAGSQQIEFFGNLRDYPGVNTDPLENDPSKTDKLKYREEFAKLRILSIQNNNRLVGFPPPKANGKPDRSGKVYLVRSEDPWIAAFGANYAKEHRLRPSYAGAAGPHPGKRGKTPAIYPEVVKSHGHVIVERIELEVSWKQGSHVPRNDHVKHLLNFASRAWRRPLIDDERRLITKMFNEEIAAGVSADDALRNSLIVVMSDTRFMYQGRASDDQRAKNYDLVSRLAYFLWNGPPDEELLAIAARDQPISDNALDQQVDRLLADKKSRRFVSEFTAQWIGFSAFDQIAIDPNYYPNWRDSIRQHMKSECVAFMTELLEKDESCLNLLDSDFVTINDRLAEHYGATGTVASHRFVRVPAPEDRGGGVLTQAAVLLAYSNGQDAHAVNRGVWLRSRLLGDPPSEPPPAVPALDDQESEEIEFLSIKQRLQKHATGTCYDCHQDIDPWGIAMEGFDATGNPRDKILKIANGKQNRRLPVVKESEVEGHALTGIRSLKKYLRKHRASDFAYGFTRHLYSYAVGREPTYRDEETLQRIQKTFEANEYKMRSLIKAVTRELQTTQTKDTDAKPN